jgi:subtilisin family serine protease
MIKRITILALAVLTFTATTPTHSFAAIIDGVTACTKKFELLTDDRDITFICTYPTGSKTKLVWKQVVSWGSKCITKNEKQVLDGTTLRCQLASGSNTKLVWVPYQLSSAGSSSKSTVPTKSKLPAAQPIIVVQSMPKPIPSLIPNTNIPWPLPTGDLNKYKGVPREKHANDQLGLAGLHSEGITGKGYSVAFIDGSIAKSHPAFSDTEVICVVADGARSAENPCPSVKEFSHGQGVAGTIGGKFGAAPGVKLISITGSMVSGLEWVLTNYKKYKITAVSLSIGEGGTRDNLVCGVASPAGFKEVLTKLSNEDVAVLFSTANQGTVNWVREPNCMPGVISVASVSSADPTQIATYSSISPDIDLLAPAEFYSTGTNGAEEMFGGTSQATPFAAALFALGKQARPEANIAQIFYYIKKTAAPVDDIYVKQIPVIRPVEMVKAIKEAKELPAITLVKQIQVKSSE